MVQIIDRPQTFLEKISPGLQSFAEAGGQIAGRHMSQQRQQQELQMHKKKQMQALELMGLDPSIAEMPEQAQAAYFKSKFPVEKPMTSLQKSQEDLNKARMREIDSVENLFKGGKNKKPEGFDDHFEDDGNDPLEFVKNRPDAELQILAGLKGQPGAKGIMGNIAQAELDRKKEEEKEKKRSFESNRAFQSSYSKKAEEDANKLRESLPKKEMALNFARNAVETGDISYFSPDKLADATGIDLFRTSKGAQLTTAGKENLLSNMSRVGSRAQNMWFEQRLNSMFPKIGQSKEANLTVQEMLEGEAEIDRAYLNAFDRLSEEDEKQHGFVKKDITKRAYDSIKSQEKEILKRTTYRMKEIEDQEKGLSGMKSQVGKNVAKGTPLTLAMAKLYKSKFGENALSVAERNGYYIPTLEEFKIFQQRPEEFREEIAK
jgi:hypothetical protein